MAQKKKEVKTTPKMLTRFSWVKQPDTKFKAEGEYSVSAILPEDSPECKEFQAYLEEQVDFSYEQAMDGAKPAVQKKIQKVYPWTEEEDDEGELTGNIMFRFKQQANVTSKKDGKTYHIQPKVFDGKGKQIEGKAIPFIGSGSTVKVNFSPWPYFHAKDKEAGISLRLNGIQILNLVSGGGSAEDYGFDAEEDGYEFDEDSANTFEDSNESEAPEDNEDF